MVDYVRNALEVTIADGQTESDAAPIGNKTVMAVETPARMTGTALTFLVSSDNSTFVQLRGQDGAAVSVTVDATAAAYALKANDTAGFNYIKVVSGSAESGAKTLKLHLESV